MSLRYQTEIEINLSRDRVVELFDNADNMFKWMDGLKEFRHISGPYGEVGSLYEIVVAMGKRSISMQEEITGKNLPHSFSMNYTMPGTLNRITNTFVDHGQNTIWGMDVEFIFSGMGMKIMSKLMPGMFRKQTLKNMQAFKEFAESQ